LRIGGLFASTNQNSLDVDGKESPRTQWSDVEEWVGCRQVEAVRGVETVNRKKGRRSPGREWSTATRIKGTIAEAETVSGGNRVGTRIA